jgi:hypothetical protein
MKRIICWFSCGAASAVAARVTIDKYRGKDHEVLVVCCDTRPSEDSDNYRFSREVELWLDQKIIYIRNDKYTDVDDVFVKTRYMSGIRGARCTAELKKLPRFAFAQADDIHVFGFTADEGKRVREFKMRNPDLLLLFPLLESRITKSMCLYRIHQAGIELPLMYRLFDAEDRLLYKQDGFDNNNCPGCVKGSSKWYWSMIRKYYPKVFELRAKRSRELGVRLVEISWHKRIFLDELPEGIYKKRKKREKMSCGPDCGINDKPEQEDLKVEVTV